MENRDLFKSSLKEKRGGSAPLAERIRPQSLHDFRGQVHIVGNDQPLRRQIETDSIPSLIFWGPPGSGKTTLARIIANQTKSSFQALSAVLAGVKELREVIEKAENELSLHNRKTILFVDEIHRWNKAQQDALLPHIENGTITLIGATTENPSFEIIGPLLSRVKVYVLHPLEEEDLRKIILNAAGPNVTIEPKGLDYMISSSDGDARRGLNTLEIGMGLVGAAPRGRPYAGQAQGP
ncbi:MAG: AAA family ATPase, partial [bacterium]|nr:AAA family ATPase [bacterium]